MTYKNSCHFRLPTLRALPGLAQVLDVISEDFAQVPYPALIYFLYFLLLVKK